MIEGIAEGKDFESKDELVVAALRRRDEEFRNHLMKQVESASVDPKGRILKVFDIMADWAGSKEFRGCMFINAAAEFADKDTAIRRAAAENKRELLRYFETLCAKLNVDSPRELAQQLQILFEGAVVISYTSEQPTGDVGAAAKAARDAASILIDSVCA